MACNKLTLRNRRTRKTNSNIARYLKCKLIIVDALDCLTINYHICHEISLVFIHCIISKLPFSCYFAHVIIRFDLYLLSKPRIILHHSKASVILRIAKPWYSLTSPAAQPTSYLKPVFPTLT